MFLQRLWNWSNYCGGEIGDEAHCFHCMQIFRDGWRTFVARMILYHMIWGFVVSHQYVERESAQLLVRTCEVRVIATSE